MSEFFQQIGCWIQHNTGDFIGHALTLGSLVIGVWVVVWQLGRQHISSLELQKENARQELKLQLYERLIEHIRGFIESNVEASIYAVSIPAKIEDYQFFLAEQFDVPLIKERTAEFARLNEAAADSIISLQKEFEAWAVAFPGLELFSAAFNAANYDIDKSFRDLHPVLVAYLPVDVINDTGNISAISRPILEETEIQKLKVLIRAYTDAMDVLSYYVHDLGVEAQNNLLSGLFEHRASGREPLDPIFKVISTSPEKTKELMKYFNEDTAWGKNNKRLATEFTES